MPADPAISIISASGPLIASVRGLWIEYWESLGLPPDFQNFAVEMEGLPGAYGPPKGRLLIALIDDRPAGAAALRPLTQLACEAKRLYVRPQFRGKGIAKSLLQRLIQEARDAGYQEMYGDTLKSMSSALVLYRAMGFSEVGPYSPNPTPGAIYLRHILL